LLPICWLAAYLFACPSAGLPIHLLAHLLSCLACREMAVALHPDKCQQPQAKEAFQVRLPLPLLHS
jgi:hypothetical protein